jgi:predicted transcriptional regulator
MNPTLKSWVEQQAKITDRSAAYIVEHAVQSLKDATDRKNRIIEDALAEAQKGLFISEEAMTKWFFSLETDPELPEPNPDVFLNCLKV